MATEKINWADVAEEAEIDSHTKDQLDQLEIAIKKEYTEVLKNRKSENGIATPPVKHEETRQKFNKFSGKATPVCADHSVKCCPKFHLFFYHIKNKTCSYSDHCSFLNNNYSDEECILHSNEFVHPPLSKPVKVPRESINLSKCC
ncbi:MAG: hypothetical protein ACYCPT_03845 [Acidimicrobiales bacterium]